MPDRHKTNKQSRRIRLKLQALRQAAKQAYNNKDLWSNLPNGQLQPPKNAHKGVAIAFGLTTLTFDTFENSQGQDEQASNFNSYETDENTVDISVNRFNKHN